MTGLWRVSTARLEALLEGLRSGRLGDSPTESSLRSSGFDSEVHHCQSILGLPTISAGVVVQACLDERRHRPPPRLDLVWTGPDASGSTVRSTAQVVESLFRRAQIEVIVAGFAFWEASKIFAPLHDAMQERGVSATFFVHRRDEQGHAMSAAAFETHSWPWRDHVPKVYEDPRVAIDPQVSMHAKCVVVDGRWLLVGSANFTTSAQYRNVELGLLVEDPVLANELAGQWKRLISSGSFRLTATT